MQWQQVGLVVVIIIFFLGQFALYGDIYLQFSNFMNKIAVICLSAKVRSYILIIMTPNASEVNYNRRH
jgi:hypothetical protein